MAEQQHRSAHTLTSVYSILSNSIYVIKGGYNIRNNCQYNATQQTTVPKMTTAEPTRLCPHKGKSLQGCLFTFHLARHT